MERGRHQGRRRLAVLDQHRFDIVGSERRIDGASAPIGVPGASLGVHEQRLEPRALRALRKGEARTVQCRDRRHASRVTHHGRGRQLGEDRVHRAPRGLVVFHPERGGSGGLAREVADDTDRLAGSDITRHAAAESRVRLVERRDLLLQAVAQDLFQLVGGLVPAESEQFHGCVIFSHPGSKPLPSAAISRMSW
jgi:hypothetical protein